MHISNLHIYSKDTDANEVIRGYKYQELKTLEDWLSNRVNEIDNRIYCDYEEDIFERNLSEYKSTFKQIKLYSSKSFSFSSSEVKKTIANFFMLFVSKEYLLDEVQFVFLTNTSIARSYGDNDAKLLSNWHDNQLNMGDDLLTKCTAKVKELISTYIQERKEDLKGDKSKIDELKKAEETYSSLPYEVWEEFVKSINWEFQSISSEEAIEDCTKLISSLISQLPFPLSHDVKDVVFATLQKEVGKKSIQSEPENRFLTNRRMDELILNLGSNSDIIYNEAYSLWEKDDSIKSFNVGEFYQILHSAKHCRRNKYLEGHSEIWKSLLGKYIELDGDLDFFKREAIYELVWITLRPEMLKKPVNSLVGLEPLIIKYFDEIDAFPFIDALEDALNLIITTYSSSKFGLLQIKEKEFLHWIDKLGLLIDQCISEAKSIDEKCGLLEIKSFFIYQKYILKIGDITIDEINKCIEEIIDLLDEAKFFAVAQLGKRLDGITNALISFDPDSKEIGLLESYRDKLLPYIEKSENDFMAAKRHVEKGTSYLKSNNDRGILNALKHFHKAKDLWFKEDAIEGYLLGLINISQLYSAVGMNLAAKYYALSAAWIAINRGEGSLYKRISDATALVFYSDYQQGAWISALDSLELYITTRSQFVSDGFDPMKDELLMKTFFNAAIILFASPKISNDINGYMEYQKVAMSDFYDDFLKDLVEETSKITDQKGLNYLIGNKLTDYPLSDLGEKREINWVALGTDWTINFENQFENNVVGEEFCAFLQIIQVELSLNGQDFHFMKSKVEIALSVSADWEEPVEVASKSMNKWIVKVPLLDSSDENEIRLHCTHMSAIAWRIIDEISVLPSKQFKKGYMELFKDQDLAAKTNVSATYQKIYNILFKKENFDNSQRNKFNRVNCEIELLTSSSMEWEDSISELYSKKKSEDLIKERYQNGNLCIKLTLEKVLDDKLFIDFYKELKGLGWLDWQIHMSLANAVLSYKVNELLDQSCFDSQQDFFIASNKKMKELLQIDEEANYIDFSVPDLVNGMKMQLEILPINVLNNFGLECKSRYPNSKKVKELLDQRFKFTEDEIAILSPFRSIPI